MHVVEQERATPRIIASARGLVSGKPVSEVAFPLADRVWGFLREHPEITHKGINIWTYRPSPVGELVVEASVELNEKFTSTEDVECSETPTGPVATCLHTGPYKGLGLAHLAIDEYCHDQGIKQEGTQWEVYGHWNEDESKLETKVFHLLIN